MATARPIAPYISPGDLMAMWPEGEPLLALKGGTGFAIIALDWAEVSAETAKNMPLLSPARPALDGLPFHHGLIGFVSYDDMAGELDGAPSRFFAVKSALILDTAKEQAFITGGDAARPEAACALLQRASVKSPKAVVPSFPLIALESDASYLAKVCQVLADIRRGDYYQINVLRRFRFPTPPRFNALTRRHNAWSGPYGALLRVSDLEIVSFSPERFVAINPNGDQSILETWPIKGSRPESLDITEDTQRILDLKSSLKDSAELAMIVDLMRNDLQQLARQGSVKVLDPGSLKTFRGIHHRVAHIQATARTPLRLGELLTILCPGGSITGAPKRAAMAAIKKYEACRRGYFMGNAILWDQLTGRFDSSILIRTAVRHGAKEYEYAAGSGIVLASDPADECAEINAKCSVLTAD